MIKLKIADFAAILISSASALITGFFIYQGYSPPELLEISSPEGRSVYQLDINREIHAHGPLGDSIIVIENKEAYFLDSPCPDKLCVKSGHLDDSGEWAGCLPNRIFIKIRGAEKENEKIDTLSF